MAPIQVSPPSAPSGVFSVFASIGDRQQIIVYAAIAIILFAIFLFAVIYILRQYNASSQDEESHTTSTPRPPLRLLLPGMTQQRTSSSASTLVQCVTPPRNSPASSKREGSIPSPLGQHVHTDPPPVALEQVVSQCALVVDNELPANVPLEGLDVIVIPEVEDKDAENAPAEAQIIHHDIDRKIKWLESGPALKVDVHYVDMMVVTLDANKRQEPPEIGTIKREVTDADAVNIGNAFLQMGDAPTSPKASKLSVRSAHSIDAKSSGHSHGRTASDPEGDTSVTQVSFKSAKCGLLPFRQEPRQGDLWAAAFDSLARRVSLDDIDAENPTIRDPNRVPEVPVFHQEVCTPEHTTRYEMANPPEPSTGCARSSDDNNDSSGTSVLAFGRRTDIAAEHPATPDVLNALSHGKPCKGVRFAGDLKAEVGDRCRVSYDVKAGYLKVKVADSITTLPPLSSGSLDDPTAPTLDHLAHIPADYVPGVGGSSESIALSTESAVLATESSSEGGLTIPPTASALMSALDIGNEECKPIIVYEDHLDENADRNQIMKNVEKNFAERERQEEGRKRQEQLDRHYASFRERRRHWHVDAPTTYTPPLTPDLGGNNWNASDSGDSDSGFSSPGTPVLGSWSETASPPLSENFAPPVAADTWKFLPGNSGSASDNLSGLALQVEYSVGDDVPLPPRRVLQASPSDEMKPIFVVEEHLDENAERNFYEYGISYSLQALGNLLMKECEKTSKRRQLEFEMAKTITEGQKAKRERAELMHEPEQDYRGLEDEPLDTASSYETISDGQVSLVEESEPMTVLSDVVTPPQEDVASQAVSPSEPARTPEDSHRSTHYSKTSEHHMSMADRATRPGRFSKLLVSLYQGFDFDVAAAIAVGLEINVEDCDTGKIVVLSDDDEDDNYPVSTVLAEEPSFDVIKKVGIKGSSVSHLLVPETSWTAPRL